MLLLINTADSQATVLVLIEGKKILVKREFQGQYHQSEKLLPALKAMLKSADATWLQLKAVGVVSGPGSFTALRLGVVTANTLAFSLRIPAVGLKLKSTDTLNGLVNQLTRRAPKAKFPALVLPLYGQAPNITRKKLLSL